MAGMRFKNERDRGEPLIAVSDAPAPLSDCGLRRKIGNLSSGSESRGSDLGPTHPSCPERLSRLLLIEALAFS